MICSPTGKLECPYSSCMWMATPNAVVTAFFQVCLSPHIVLPCVIEHIMVRQPGFLWGPTLCCPQSFLVLWIFAYRVIFIYIRKDLYCLAKAAIWPQTGQLKQRNLLYQVLESPRSRSQPHSLDDSKTTFLLCPHMVFALCICTLPVSPLLLMTTSQTGLKSTILTHYNLNTTVKVTMLNKVTFWSNGG
jgi:hypothetical protein